MKNHIIFMPICTFLYFLWETMPYFIFLYIQQHFISKNKNPLLIFHKHILFILFRDILNKFRHISFFCYNIFYNNK